MFVQLGKKTGPNAKGPAPRPLQKVILGIRMYPFPFHSGSIMVPFGLPRGIYGDSFSAENKDK